MSNPPISGAPVVCVAFGRFAVPEALGDLDVLAEGVRRALAELVAVAQEPDAAHRKT